MSKPDPRAARPTTTPRAVQPSPLPKTPALVRRAAAAAVITSAIGCGGAEPVPPQAPQIPIAPQPAPQPDINQMQPPQAAPQPTPIPPQAPPIPPQAPPR